MRKIFAIVVILVCAASFSAKAQMSDSAVQEYVKSAYASGKSETQIATELAARGVSTAQLQRIKNSLTSKAGDKTAVKDASESRLRQRVGEKEVSPVKGKNKNSQYMNAKNPGAKNQQIKSMYNLGKKVVLYDDEGNPVEVPLSAFEEKEETPIFGHDIFSSFEELTFEPNENQATPENYKLGPGDEVIIDIWGANEANIRQTISPEGRIIVSQLGPIYLNGLTITQAAAKIKKVASQIYAGVEGERPVSDISVTLGQNRTIQVNVMGDVNTPGTYRLSGFATVFNAIYRAGGITDIGSLRNIHVLRGGKNIADVDVYDFIFYGKQSVDVKLQDGDVVQVPAYGTLVQVAGSVKRPMKYELKDGETVASLVTFAGGFAGDAYSNDLNIVRQTGKEKRVHTVAEKNYSSFALCDGDFVTVGSVIDRYENKVEVNGAVFRPGIFELGSEIATVKQLVLHAGGLTEEAFLNRAVIIREKDDLSLETVSVNLGGIMNGTASDVLLKKNDILTVSNIHKIDEVGTLSILGYVENPGEYEFAEGTSIEDLILIAGGLKKGASTAKVDVARRIDDKNATEKSELYSETFTFSISEGLVIGGEEFILQPYDVVSVRRSPGYQEQKIVTVNGEVNFAGEYALVNGAERLSDLVKRAGGASSVAYLKGGRLTRRMTDDEIAMRLASADKMTFENEADSLKFQRQLEKTSFTVGIQLDKAISNPGSDYDIILRDGDVLDVPEYIGTVKVNGAVMNPNTVSFISGKPVSHFVNLAGGYTMKAKRSRTYVVYMNGNVALARRGGKVEPGCEIIVPKKPERTPMPATAYISLGTSAASMAMVIMNIVNMVK